MTPRLATLNALWLVSIDGVMLWPLRLLFADCFMQGLYEQGRLREGKLTKFATATPHNEKYWITSDVIGKYWKETQKRKEPL